MKGSLQIKKGRYYYVTYLNNDGAKKQVWFALGLKASEKKSLVFAKKKALEMQLNAKYPSATKKATKKILFCKFLDVWLNNKQKSIRQSSYLSYTNNLNVLKRFFESNGLFLGEVCHFDINNFLESRKKCGDKKVTIVRYCILLNNIFNFAIKQNLLFYNPMARVEIPKTENFEAKFLDKTQLRRILQILDIDDPFSIKAPITLLVAYGLRRSEVVGLRWSAIDFKNKQILINHSVVEVRAPGSPALVISDNLKTQSSHRCLPLLPKIETMLLNLKAQINANKKFWGKQYCTRFLDYVCVTKKGKLVRPSTLTKKFKLFLQANKLPCIRLHDLRHSCASLLVNNGVDIKNIQSWLGHASFATTANIYSHLSFVNKISGANILESSIFNGNLEVDNADVC